MRTGPRGAPAAMALACCLALGACGSQTKTVTATGAPPAPATSAQVTTAPAGPSASTGASGSTAPAPAPASAGGTPAPQATRTAPEPAFAEQGQQGGGEGLSGALAVVHARGFSAPETATYHPDQTLRVLVGTRPGVGEQAFFFVDGRFIGTDSSQPSASVKALSQGDTEVTLAYTLYHPGDQAGSASGGQAQVRFQLDNGMLTALDPIPPASPGATLSRR